MYNFRLNGNTSYLFLNWDELFDKTPHVNAVKKLQKLPEDKENKNKTQVNSEDDSEEDNDVKQLQELLSK